MAGLDLEEIALRAQSAGKTIALPKDETPAKSKPEVEVVKARAPRTKPANSRRSPHQAKREYIIYLPAQLRSRWRAKAGAEGVSAATIMFAAVAAHHAAVTAAIRADREARVTRDSSNNVQKSVTAYSDDMAEQVDRHVQEACGGVERNRSEYVSRVLELYLDS